jgi:hypothetical protein
LEAIQQTCLQWYITVWGDTGAFMPPAHDHGRYSMQNENVLDAVYANY